MACVISIFNSQFFAQAIFNNEISIRVLTFNILHGATINGDFNLDIIADVIIRTEPDLVALQEVDFKTNRAKKYDLVVELAKRTGLVPLFGRAMYYDDGEYGEGILSKTTIINSRNVALPHLEGYEPRTALEILTVVGTNDTIAFVSTHLDHVKDDSNRIMQAEKIISVFSKNKYPTILAGDLNDLPGSKTINMLETIWTPTYNKEKPEPTYPSDFPKIKIDYIMYFPKPSWELISSEVIQDSTASDHCAYLSVLKLKSKNKSLE